MGTEFTIGELTHFETKEDGSHIRLDMLDVGGRQLSLHMPLDCLTRLIMTLPFMVTQAARKLLSDPTLRMVLPVESLEVDANDDQAARILTVAASDGFRMSFALTEEQFLEVGAGLRQGAPLAGSFN